MSAQLSYPRPPSKLAHLVYIALSVSSPDNGQPTASRRPGNAAIIVLKRRLSEIQCMELVSKSDARWVCDQKKIILNTIYLISSLMLKCTKRNKIK